jgi:drug/metabolite transporter (DMT)-like permease
MSVTAGVSPLGVGLALLGAIGLAVSAVAIRLGTREGSSSDALLVILTTNALVFVPLGTVTYWETGTLTVASAAAFAATGLIGTLLARQLYYASIERIGASRAEPIKSTQPLFASIIAVVVLGETLSPLHATGILLMILGIALVSVETSGDTVTAHDATLATLLLPTTAAFLWGIEPIFAKIGIEAGTAVFVGLAIKTLFATGSLAGYLWWRGELSFATTDRTTIGWYLVAGVANTVFLYGYYTSLELSVVSVTVPIVQTSPVFVVALSLVFLQRLEQVSWRLVAATLVVVAGSVVVVASG